MQALKPFQVDALESLRRHPHTLLLAPTGSGKSLVFQTYVRETPVRAVLVSPLNALARQHEAGLQAQGVPVSLGVGPGGSGPPGRSGVWILNPEKIAGRFFRELRDWAPGLLIVDEAHCVFEWGERFRPHFASLPEWVREFRIPKTFWCTATLTAASVERLRGRLGSDLRVLGGFALPERLALSVERVRPFERMDRLRAFLATSGSDSGMIFVNTRLASERVRAWLSGWGYSSVFYHAGMGLEERIALEALLRKRGAAGEGLWVVATSAFGMGMDYPFLRRCILFEPAFSLLATAQALGRVGRAGAWAHAAVLWHEDDFLRHSWLGQDSDPSRIAFQEVRAWCSGPGCPRTNLENHFGMPAPRSNRS